MQAPAFEKGGARWREEANAEIEGSSFSIWNAKIFRSRSGGARKGSSRRWPICCWKRWEGDRDIEGKGRLG